MKEIAQHISYRKTLIFAMAKIRRIGHDHHAPFQVVLVVVVLLLLLLLHLKNQAVTRGENKLPHE